MSTLTQSKPARTAGPGTPGRPRILTGQLAVVLMSSFGALTSFYLLLSVTPMLCVSAGTGNAGAGLVTGSLMLSCVLAEFAAAGLMRRYGSRAVFALGALLLGGPVVALLAPGQLVTIVAVSLVRGFGFGLNTVVTGALVATALPRERRGEGLGLAGVVACVPAIVALPSGVWLAQHTSYPVVIAMTAAAALVPLAAVPWLPGAAGAADRAGAAGGTAGAACGQPAADANAGPGPQAGLLAGLRSGSLRRLSLVFAATTVSAGVLVAFLPLAAGAAASLAAAGLFAQAVTATLGRWLAGRYGDRHGHAGLLVPGLLAAAAGMIMLIWVPAPAAVITGMCLFGAGFGISQNATFALMIDRVPPSGYGMVSALWNLAYDAGYGAGPAAFGLFAARTGYPVAFALTGLLMLAALAPAWRERPAAGVSRRSGVSPR